MMAWSPSLLSMPASQLAFECEYLLEARLACDFLSLPSWLLVDSSGPSFLVLDSCTTVVAAVASPAARYDIFLLAAATISFC